MNALEYRKTLNEYYNKNIIQYFGENSKFLCTYATSCQICKSEDEDKVYLPKFPYIGECYNDEEKLRILIISSDPGKSSKNNRTSEQVHKIENRIQFPSYKKERHWYYTYKLLNNLLGFKEKDIKCQKYFTHLNSAKCSQKKRGNRQASGRLFENCKNHVFKEIEILKPNIIITQGDKAANALKFYLNAKDEEIDLKDSGQWVFEKSIYIIRTYHPSYFRKYFNDKSRGVKTLIKKWKNDISYLST